VSALSAAAKRSEWVGCDAHASIVLQRKLLLDILSKAAMPRPQYLVLVRLLRVFTLRLQRPAQWVQYIDSAACRNPCLMRADCLACRYTHRPTDDSSTTANRTTTADMRGRLGLVPSAEL